MLFFTIQSYSKSRIHTYLYRNMILQFESTSNKSTDIASQIKAKSRLKKVTSGPKSDVTDSVIYRLTANTNSSRSLGISLETNYLMLSQ